MKMSAHVASSRVVATVAAHGKVVLVVGHAAQKVIVVDLVVVPRVVPAKKPAALAATLLAVTDREQSALLPIDPVRTDRVQIVLAEMVFVRMHRVLTDHVRTDLAQIVLAVMVFVQMHRAQTVHVRIDRAQIDPAMVAPHVLANAKARQVEAARRHVKPVFTAPVAQRLADPR